jgi:MFS family permease
LFAPLKIRNFRLLWTGETISVLGDQFYFVALPWLALQVSGSGLALGSVLTAAAIPRAALMLLGGATTDRFSSRTVMLASNVARCAIVCVMTLLVSTGAARLWHLYLLGAAFGMFDAFFYPAYVSILPSLLEPAQLVAGNSLMQSSVQLTSLIGPATAGVIISTAGLAAAFGLDAASFLVSITMLSLISIAGDCAAGQKSAALLASIREGVQYVLRDPAIRSMLVAFAVMNIFLTGPFMVGAPLLAKVRFGGATSLGLLYSSFGGGALVGALAAGHHPRQHRLGPLFVTVYTAAGATMIALGFIWHLWIASAVLLLLGLIVGYSNIHMMALLQRKTEPEKMGRVMSLVMFCAHGLLPLSYITSGAVSEISSVVLFLGSGVIVIAISTFLFRPAPFWERP